MQNLFLIDRPKEKFKSPFLEALLRRQQIQLLDYGKRWHYLPECIRIVRTWYNHYLAPDVAATYAEL